MYEIKIDNVEEKINVFYLSFIKILLTPSKAEATAKSVLGLISRCPSSIDFNRLSAVSLTPDIISVNLSVFAVHKTITLSNFFVSLKEEISLLRASNCSFFVPIIKLFARDSYTRRYYKHWHMIFRCISYELQVIFTWLAAMKSGKYTLFLGTISCMWGRSCFCKLTSKTFARCIASARLRLEISQPSISMSFGLTIGNSQDIGTLISSAPVPPVFPRRTVDASISEPYLYLITRMANLHLELQIN